VWRSSARCRSDRAGKLTIELARPGLRDERRPLGVAKGEGRPGRILRVAHRNALSRQLGYSHTFASTCTKGTNAPFDRRPCRVIQSACLRASHERVARLLYDASPRIARQRVSNLVIWGYFRRQNLLGSIGRRLGKQGLTAEILPLWPVFNPATRKARESLRCDNRYVTDKRANRPGELAGRRNE